MSELRSLLDQLDVIDLDAMSVDELDADIDELVLGSQMIDVMLARRVRGMADRNGHVELGHPSPMAYLMAKGMSTVTAKRHVTRANGRDEAPVTFQAWADGRISTDQTTQLLRMASTVPDQFPDAEANLVDIVEPLSVKATTKVLDYWRQTVRWTGRPPARNTAHTTRYLAVQNHRRDATHRRVACGTGGRSRRSGPWHLHATTV